MAQYYQKINTLYKRDSNNKNAIIEGDYSIPEFEYLKNCMFNVEEKIDGTSMSYHIYFNTDGTIADWEIHGKTENAKIPTGLMDEMNRLFNSFASKMSDTFVRKSVDANSGVETATWPYKVVIYGEGYGGKIQSGGRYSKTEKFVVFDIAIQSSIDGSEVYLLRNNVEDICKKLNLDISHCYGQMTISEAEDIIKTIAKWVYQKNGNIRRTDIPDMLWEDEVFPNCMFSNHAEDKNLVIEGFVLKSPLGLMTRLGKPIVVKVKVKDYIDILKKNNNK